MSTPALERYFDHRARHVVSNVGKVFGFSIGYTLATGKGHGFGLKLLSGLGLAIGLGLVGKLIDNQYSTP